MTNTIHAIHAYRYKGVWVTDDMAVGLLRSPLASGERTIIDRLIEGVSGAAERFTFLFSASPFPGFQTELEWRREDQDGHWYFCAEWEMEGLLSPAIFKNLDDTPPKIFAQCKGKGAGIESAGSAEVVFLNPGVNPWPGGENRWFPICPERAVEFLPPFAARFFEEMKSKFPAIFKSLRFMGWPEDSDLFAVHDSYECPLCIQIDFVMGLIIIWSPQIGGREHGEWGRGVDVQVEGAMKHVASILSASTG